ncbi:hypothetical protein FGO68_gene1026 [Halteria grandinella]|uniref:Uncharacterized protein n=1 Tax=Halteria grandinella TaxID=5974 RepID=A0A8J8NMM6_HALGN|nr:hypothetical protein FGO68_gene1026 [Halteria grandinella]
MIIEWATEHWIQIFLISWVVLYNVWPQSRKELGKQVVVITGGAQGLGKQMGLLFAKEHAGITLIIIDIQAQQGAETVTEIKSLSGLSSVYYLHCDLSDPAQLTTTWSQITSRFGQVNILINNAARALGKEFSTLTIDQYRKTIDINFLSIVHLTKLFTEQEAVKESLVKGEYQLVNVNSIGSFMAQRQWSDYGASKFALRGFTQALRYELNEELPNLVITNIYPYHINTRMFEGFKPLIRKLIPSIDPVYAAQRIHRAILYQEREVHIWWYLYYIRIILELLPLSIQLFLVKHLIGQGMQTFVGNQQKPYAGEESKQQQFKRAKKVQ